MSGFKIGGEFLTKVIRETWVGGDEDNAINIGMEGLGLSFEQVMDVIIGKKKLVGADNLISLEDDDASKIHGMELNNHRAKHLMYGEVPVNFNLVETKPETKEKEININFDLVLYKSIFNLQKT